MAAATMLMYEYESDLRSNVHYLGSCENKAQKKKKKNRPVRDLNSCILIFIYLYFTGLFETTVMVSSQLAFKLSW